MSLTMQVATHTAKNGTHLRDEEGQYSWEGEQYPSVTTVLKVVGKPALLFWAADTVARAACEAYARTEKFRAGDAELEEFPEYNTLRNAPWDQRDAKASIGTATHDCLERYAKGLEVDLADYHPDVRPYAQSALAWLKESNPTFLLSERACFSRKNRYAGTFDAVVELEGRLLVLDYKTSKATYEDHALQLSAYRHAEFVAGDDGEELPMPQVEGGAILVVQPERAKLYEWDCGPEVFRHFLAAKRIYDWKARSPKPVLLNRKKRGTK